jgi:hypothetical protein
MSQFGGSQKTETRLQSGSLIGITPAADTKTAGNPSCFAAPVRRLSSAHGKGMHFGYGEGSKTTAAKLALTARSSETKACTSLPSLSDRLTPSLISAGLVCGIIPLSMRDSSGQQTLAAVLRPQGGKIVGGQKLVS